VPTYDFLDESGCRVALDLPIGTAPKSGDSAVFEGRRLTRLPSLPGALRVAPNVGFQSISLPLNWEHAPRHAENGESVFHSQREVTESLARANDHNEKLIYE
jgi:hypothetical protein